MKKLKDVYLAVRGELPKKRDVSEWSEMKIVSYLDFVNHFIEKGVKKDKHGRKIETLIIKVTDTKRKSAEEREEWKEFVERIDKLTTRENETCMQFFYRLNAMSRCVIGFLKDNPWKITENMEKVMRDNPRLEWGLKNYRTETTKIGAEVVESDTFDNTPFPTRVKNPEKLYANSLLKLAGIAEDLLKNIKKSDIQRMSAGERIRLGLSVVTAVSKNLKEYTPNKQVFNQLNIYQDGRDKLEEALQQFNSQKTK